MPDDLIPQPQQDPQALVMFWNEEGRAERKLLAPVAAKNISDLFESGVSVNRISGNWKVFRDSKFKDQFLSLQNVATLAIAFLDWWALKDAEIADRKNDPQLQGDLVFYIANVVWEQKYKKDFFADNDCRGYMHRFKQLKAFRTAVMEAVNRGMNTSCVDNEDGVDQLVDKGFEEHWDPDKWKAMLRSKRVMSKEEVITLRDALTKELDGVVCRLFQTLLEGKEIAS